MEENYTILMEKPDRKSYNQPQQIPFREFKMKKKAILFDVDGVLIDVRASYIETIRQTVERYLAKLPNIRAGTGSLLSPNDVNRFKLLGGFNNDWDTVYGLLLYFLSLAKKIGGPEVSFTKLSRFKNFEILSRRVPHPCGVKGIEKLTGRNRAVCYETAKNMFQEIYLGEKLFRKLYRRNPESKPRRGLIEKEKLLIPPKILSSLKKGGARLGIVTGRTRFEAEYVLKRFGISSLFDILVKHDEIERAEKKHGRPLGKPHSYPVLLCAGKIKADSFFYVGDLPDDIKAANGAKEKIKITSCGFLWRQDRLSVMEKALKSARPDLFIRHPSDLPGLLRR